MFYKLLTKCLMTTAMILSVVNVAQISGAVSIDIVGGTANTASPNPWTGKGNAFQVNTSTTLIEEEFYLRFNGSKKVSFYVYTSPVEFGTYSRIYNTTLNFVGNGTAKWCSSGSMNVPLNAGTYYITAFSAPSDVSYYYYFNAGESQLVSFGKDVHGYATGNDPLGATISSTSNDQAIYYERLTTNIVPEPSTIVLLSMGALGLTVVNAWRRRK